MAAYACWCCGHRTLPEEPPGTFTLCPVCFWEDDVALGLDRAGGANSVSLREARANFERYGACDEAARPHVRPPGSEELPRTEWSQDELPGDPG